MRAPHEEAGSSPGSYPADIAPLRALNFFALGWVVVNQFRDHLGLHAGAAFGLIGKGYLGAGLFLVTAGFVAAHDYARLRVEGRFRYPRFLWDRLVQFYPLHIVTLAAMGGLFLAGRAVGVRVDAAAFDPAALPANLLLIHAWGVLPTVSWNFPSWLVSALWFGLLTLPATAWLALKGLRPLLAIVAALIVFVASFEVAGARGYLFTDMTAQIGALQSVPAFLYGAGFCALSRQTRLSAPWAGLVAGAAVLWIVAAASLRLTDLAIWPAFGPLVFALAQTANNPAPARAPRPFQALGAMALSMYLVYLPVDIVYFHAIERFIAVPLGAVAWLVWLGVFPIILIAGALAYRLVTRPAAKWLQDHAPFASPMA